MHVLLLGKKRIVPPFGRCCASTLMVALFLLMSLATACGAGADAADSQDLLVNLPADEGAHPAGIEWWYFNGHLTDDADRDYSFHFVTFQIGANQYGNDISQAGQLLQLSWGDHRNQVFSEPGPSPVMLNAPVAGSSS